MDETNADVLPGEFTLRLPAAVESARLARARLRELLAQLRSTGDVAREAELVLHELVMNGVVHGAPDSDGMVEIVCAVEPGGLLIRVHDSGSGGDVAVRPPTDHLPSGRGLAMLAALSSSWAVDRSNGTTVSARLEL